jgi:hypothetical protein
MSRAARGTVVLDWFHIAMRFEQVQQAAIGLGAGTVNAHLGDPSRCEIAHANWRLWLSRRKGCLVKLASAYRCQMRPRRRRHPNFAAPFNGSVRLSRGEQLCACEPMAPAAGAGNPFQLDSLRARSARRMIKKQQMRWDSWAVQPFLDLRVVVLNGTRLYPDFRSANGPRSNFCRSLNPPRFCMLSNGNVSPGTTMTMVHRIVETGVRRHRLTTTTSAAAGHRRPAAGFDAYVVCPEAMALAPDISVFRERATG